MSDEIGGGRNSHVMGWSWNIMCQRMIPLYSTVLYLLTLWLNSQACEKLRVQERTTIYKFSLVPIFVKSAPITIRCYLLSYLNHSEQFRFCCRMIWKRWRIHSKIYLLWWIINVFPILFPISNCIHLYNSTGVIYSVKFQYKNAPDSTMPAVKIWPRFAQSERPLIIKLLRS